MTSRLGSLFVTAKLWRSKAFLNHHNCFAIIHTAKTFRGLEARACSVAAGTVTVRRPLRIFLRSHEHQPKHRGRDSEQAAWVLHDARLSSPLHLFNVPLFPLHFSASEPSSPAVYTFNRAFSSSVEMGGNAFNKHTPPLPTPRMPPEIYKLILSRTLTTLRQHYQHVGSPIEAPGKPDFGDIDITVASPLSRDFDPLIANRQIVCQNLAKSLNAAASILESGNPTINLAVPWPTVEGGEKEEKRYVQIDVHVCANEKDLTWNLFHAAHGDLWNILGTTIRPFGLTVNDKGMYLRIREIELLDRRKSMVFLTGKPGGILEFLGLEEGKWWSEFGDRREMFEFAAGCRMFWVKEREKEVEVEDGEGVGDVVGEIEGGIGGQEGGEKGKKKLKHNDRQRMAKRPIFREWIEEFIPLLREEGRCHECKVTRDQIREEAFAKWGVQEEYEERLKVWRLARHEDELWREVIKGSIPEDVDPQFRGAAIRQLKAVIMEGEEWEGVVPDAAKKNEEGFHDLEVVRAFVLENWKRAGEFGWERQQKRAMEGQKAKAEKKKAGEGSKEVAS